jgi:hypothetical protein
VFAVIFGGQLPLPPDFFGALRVAVGLLMGLLIGWRMAYDVHFWEADEYGGAYTPPERFRRARRTYLALLPLYLVAGFATAFSVLRLRGLLDG